MKPRLINTKQMGDACEMLVAAEMTLAGVPAVKMPDNWPVYDLIAFPKDSEIPQKISVKSRTFKRGSDTDVEYWIKANFDWMAVVILPDKEQGELCRRVFIFPKAVSDGCFHRYGDSSKNHNWMHVRIDELAKILPKFENNFALSRTGIGDDK
jgi:hypothetical protein